MNRIKQNFILVALMTMFIVNSSLWSQDGEEDSLKLKFKFEPESIQLGVGDTVSVKIQLLNEAGEVHKMPFILFARGAEARRSVEILPRRAKGGSVDAKVIAHRPGTFKVNARSVTVK